MAEVEYTSVSWTAGDVITEAKLDAMVANDQAVDAHAQGIRFDARSAPADADVDASELHLYAKDLGTLIQLYYKEGDNDVEKLIDAWNKVSLSDGATIAVDWAKGNVQEVTLGGDRTFTFSNGVSGGKYILVMKQDATGSRNPSWPASVKWSAGSEPTWSTAANAIDLVGFIYDGTNYLGFALTGFA